MDDLERQLHDFAHRLDLPEPVEADEILRRSDHRPGSHRAFLAAAVLLVARPASRRTRGRRAAAVRRRR